MKVRFCTTSCGHCCCQPEFMDRISVFPPPLSVTLPPPSSTTRWLLVGTVAVAVMVIVTGFWPQLNVMTPPAATAATTAAGVQLAGVPLPITWSG